MKKQHSSREDIILSEEDHKKLTSLFQAVMPGLTDLMNEANERGEPLAPLTSRCLGAFKEVNNLLETKNRLPFIPTSNPHDLDQGALMTAQSTAMATVYGVNPEFYKKYSPRSVQALQAMQPLANALHDYAIFS